MQVNRVPSLLDRAQLGGGGGDFLMPRVGDSPNCTKKVCVAGFVGAFA